MGERLTIIALWLSIRAIRIESRNNEKKQKNKPTWFSSEWKKVKYEDYEYCFSLYFRYMTVSEWSLMHR